VEARQRERALKRSGSIRPYRLVDEAAVADVWHRSGRAAYPFLPTWQALDAHEARRVFREVIVPDREIWVAVEGERIVGYLSLDKSYLDRLYIDPANQRRGWGVRLLVYAKSRNPLGLSLHTHQENRAARAFYEAHGFIAVRFGLSPPPERAPDVEYHWGSPPARRPPP
jgi:ribosomal protein S18 acetylase RimI-like enzyme